MEIKIDASDVIKDLQGTSEQINRARKKALTKTSKWVGSQIAKKLSASNNIKQKSLKSGKGQRVYVNAPKKPDSTRASIYVGLNPVKVGFIGGSKSNQGKGARVGNHFFKGSFVAKMQSSKKSLFFRHSKARLPISEQELELLETVSAIDGVKSKIPERLKKDLDHALNFELNVRGR